jgi:hypothetical protein
MPSPRIRLIFELMSFIGELGKMSSRRDAETLSRPLRPSIITLASPQVCVAMTNMRFFHERHAGIHKHTVLIFQ